MKRPATAKPRRRRGLKIMTAVVILFVALWCGYWYATNRMITSAIAQVAASFAAKGRALTCAENAVGGFPLSLDFDCGSPAYADGTADISAGLGRVRASAPLYWPGSASTALVGPLVFKAPRLGIVFDASWSQGAASAEAGLGGLDSANATFDELAITSARPTKALPIISISAFHAEAAAEPSHGNAYHFAAEGEGIVVKPAGAAPLPELDAAIAVRALNFGGSLGTDPGRKFAAWLAAGGKLEVERLMVAIGRMSATASGTLAVSPAGLVSGVLTVRLVGLDGVSDAVAGMKPKTRKKIVQAVAALSAFTKPAEGDPNARDAPVSIRNGVISVGVIPVGEIPPLKF